MAWIDNHHRQIASLLLGPTRAETGRLPSVGLRMNDVPANPDRTAAREEAQQGAPLPSNVPHSDPRRHALAWAERRRRGDNIRDP
jgi:hypothetical protein